MPHLAALGNPKPLVRADCALSSLDWAVRVAGLGA